MVLEPWQRHVTERIFARDPETGRRRHRRAMVGTARKNGKSGFAAILALFGLMAEIDGAEVYCLDPMTPVLTDDLRWVPVGSVSVGDGLLAFDEEPAGGYRKLRMARVESTDLIIQPCHRVTLDDGREVIASAGHLWLGKNGPTGGITNWIRTDGLREGARIRDIGTPWVTDDSRSGGYLAGILDGEGCIVGGQGGSYRRGSIVSFAQKPGIVWDTALGYLTERGYSVHTRTQRLGSGVREAKVTGLSECLRLLGTTRPVRLLGKVPRWLDGQTPNRMRTARVVSVEPVGDRQVVAIGTSTKTLFANGLFSHNSCAADRDQAKLIFTAARRMVEMDPELRDAVKLYRDAIEYPAGGSVYRALSSEAFTKEGLSPSLVIYDELHAAPDRELYDVMSLAMGARRDPLMVIVTTAGVMVDRFGHPTIAKQLYDLGRRIATGEVDDPTYYMAWWEPADPDSPPDDPTGWREANPSLGTILDPEDMRSALPPATPENEYRTKRRNQWVAASRSWLPFGAWDACADPDRIVGPDEPVYLTFDGSWTNDSTGIGGVTIEPSPHLFTVELWEPHLTGEHIEAQLVDDTLERLHAERNVKGIIADPAQWREQIARWKERGWVVIEFPNVLPRTIPAIREFYAAVTESAEAVRSGHPEKRRITHDGDPRMARHIANATTKEDSRGVRIVKQARGQKIDLAICAFMGYDVARTVPERPPEVRFYAFD